MAHPKGGITGSDRVKSGAKKRGRPPKNTGEPNKSALETLGQTSQNIANAIDGVTDTLGQLKDQTQSVGNSVKKARAIFKPSTLVEGDSSEAISQAADMASSYGFQLTNFENALSGSNYEVNENLPQMTSKEANQKQLIIERQNNALDVAFARIKQKRKQARNHKEEWGLVGDVVDIGIAKKQVATKVVNYQIEDTKFRTTQSKLEEQEELLEQQIIRTQGVISLTEGVREEWDLRLQKQQASNESLMIQIEQSNNKNARDREKIESYLFEAGD